MKYLFPLLIISTLLTSSNPLRGEQISVGCGQGIIQRASGDVIIDGYLVYTSSLNSTDPSQQKLTVTPTINPMPTWGPPSITLASTIKDTTRICFENSTPNNGTSCFSMWEIKQKLFPPAAPKNPIIVPKK